MDDATYEQTLDRRIMRRLGTDLAYKHAEDAEQQSEREREIEVEEVARLDEQIDRARRARGASAA